MKGGNGAAEVYFALTGGHQVRQSSKIGPASLARPFVCVYHHRAHFPSFFPVRKIVSLSSLSCSFEGLGKGRKKAMKERLSRAGESVPRRRELRQREGKGMDGGAYLFPKPSLKAENRADGEKLQFHASLANDSRCALLVSPPSFCLELVTSPSFSLRRRPSRSLSFF